MTLSQPRNPKNYVIGFIVMIFIMILCNSSRAQNSWYRTSYLNAAPTANPTVSPVVKYAAIDTLNSHGYIWNGTLLKWNLADGIIRGIQGIQGNAGTNGINGTNGITPVLQSGTTTTLPAGSSATSSLTVVSSNTYALNFGVPKGADGTGGGGVPGIISPDSYQADHRNGSTLDADAIQNAITNGSGKTIYLYGTYYLNHAIVIPKYIDVHIEGSALMYLQGSWTGAAFQRANPSSLNDAIVYMNYHSEFHNITISCSNGNQSGFDIKAGSNILYDHCVVINALWGFRSEFQLLATYNECTVLNSTNGFYIGVGTFSGASINNSQSNVTRLFKPHCGTISNIGIYVDATYEVMMDQVAIEGNGTCQYGIYYDMQSSTTSKNGSINFFHGEQSGGAVKAWIYVSMSNGTLNIDNVICHYAGLVVDANSTNSTGVINMSYFNYAVGDANGKYFNSRGTMNFIFYGCYSFYPTVVPTRFVAPAPTYCTNFAGCSGNTFQLVTSR